MGIIRDTFFPTVNTEYIFFGVYFGLCLAYMTFGIQLNKKLVKATLKCAPVAFLVVFFFSTVLRMDFGPANDKVNLERVLFGLLFSLLGDFYLVFDSFFMLGILAFASAHILYARLFDGGNILFTAYYQNELVSAVAVALVTILIYLYILPKLSWVLVLPAAIYSFLISVMLWCAITTMLRDPRPATQQGALGACLFYTSDLILSVNRWRIKLPYGSHIVIGTYYCAQILIFLSVINN